MTANEWKPLQRLQGDGTCSLSPSKNGDQAKEIACPSSKQKCGRSVGVDALLRSFSILSLLLILFVESGQAQSVFKSAHGEWEASIFGSGSFLGDGEHITPSEGSGQPSSRTVGLSYGTGAQLGIRVTDNRWQH